MPRSEWTHYFVQGLLPEIREYVVLQQPENLEAAENFAKLKESVLANSVKHAAFDPKEVSAQILEELSKEAKEKTISAVGQTEPYVNKSEIKQIIREEFRELMGNSSSRPNRYNQRNNSQSFQQRSFRSRFGDAICNYCGKKGHTYYFCRSRPDPRVPRRGGGGQNTYHERGQSSSNWESKQGN